MTKHSQNIPYKTAETDAYEISNQAVLSKYPLVSVAMITYNHAPYIAQAIQGVLMQRTDFPIELIIGEDCSTDRTREIVLNYQEQYPDRIRVITSDNNVGMMNNSNRTMVACCSKYIALCEGDDYWTSPHKLQKQVDFLEDNPDFAICFHNMRIIDEDKPHLTRVSNIKQKEITDINTLALGNYIFTASCIFRKNFSRMPDWFYQCPVGDYPLHLLNAQYGKIKFIDEVMGVYRVHQGGIWENKNLLYRLEEWAKMLEMIRGNFNSNIKRILNNSLNKTYFQLALNYLKDNDYKQYSSYSKKIAANDPSYVYRFKIMVLYLKYLRTLVKNRI